MFFDNPEQAEASYMSNAPTVLAGIDFTAHLHDLNYTLRFPTDLIASTKIHYSTQGKFEKEKKKKTKKKPTKMVIPFGLIINSGSAVLVICVFLVLPPLR